MLESFIRTWRLRAHQTTEIAGVGHKKAIVQRLYIPKPDNITVWMDFYDITLIESFYIPYAKTTAQ
jgi:hypothetical protein